MRVATEWNEITDNNPAPTNRDIILCVANGSADNTNMAICEYDEKTKKHYHGDGEMDYFNLATHWAEIPAAPIRK